MILYLHRFAHKYLCLHPFVHKYMYLRQKTYEEMMTTLPMMHLFYKYTTAQYANTFIQWLQQIQCSVCMLIGQEKFVY